MKFTTYAMVGLLLFGCAEPSVEENSEPIEALEEAAASDIKFGTSCQETFEVDPATGLPWIGTLSGTFTECARFNDTMANYAVNSYYWNLVGAKQYYESTRDEQRLDSVDIHYNSSHGGGWTAPLVARFTMFEKSTGAMSTSMRLGDESVGLSVLVSHSCGQLVLDGNSNIWTRWGPVMRGGLRMALAARTDMYSGGEISNMGKYLAEYLGAGQAFAYAWASAATRVDSRHSPVALAAGNSDADCAARRDNIKLSDFRTYPRRRDASVSVLCWRYWN